MYRRGLALTALVAALLSAPPAWADAPLDYIGPRELALGDSQRADARGSLAVTLNPAGLGLTREVVFDGAYGRRFTDGANLVTLSACDSTVAVPGCFYYRYFSGNLLVDGVDASRRVHEGGLVLGRAVTERIMAGVGLKYFDEDFTALPDGDASGVELDVGAIVQATSVLSAGVVGYNLLGGRSPQYRRSVGAGLSVRPVGGLGISFDALWSLDTDEGESTGRYGGGIEYFIASSDMQSGYPVRLGAVHDVGMGGTFLSAGLGLSTAKLGLDLGGRRQIQGGDELVIQVGLRIYGPRQVPGTTEYR